MDKIKGLIDAPFTPFYSTRTGKLITSPLKIMRNFL